MDIITNKNYKCAYNLKDNTKICYSKESLINILKNIKIIKYNENESKEMLWKKIKKYFFKKCNNNDACWLKQNEIKKIDNKTKYFTFKPEYKESWIKNKYTWLNSHDIYLLMKQFENKYSNFIFLGPVPSDCPTSISCELSNIDFNNLKKKKINNIGIIYNLDKHDQPGSHWTAVYIDINKNNINYYDSYGEVPPKSIYNFMLNTSYKLDKTNNKESFLIYNDKRHQYGNSECGIFSIYFILQRLTGKNMYQIFKENIKDKKMNDLRNNLFTKYIN